jgi:hypothetical protein
MSDAPQFEPFDYAASDWRDRIRFASTRKRNSAGSASLPITAVNRDGDETPIFIKTPIMMAPFGIQSRGGKDDGKDDMGNVEMCLSFTGTTWDPEKEAFVCVNPNDPDHVRSLEFLKWYDEFFDFFTSKVFDNKDTLLGRKADGFEKKHIQNLAYQPKRLGDTQRERGYAPFLKAKLLLSKGAVATKLFNAAGQELTLEDLEGVRQFPTTNILKISGIWFNQSSFGISFNIVQSMIKNRKKTVDLDQPLFKFTADPEECDIGPDAKRRRIEDDENKENVDPVEYGA